MPENSGRFKVTSTPTGHGSYDICVEDTVTGDKREGYAFSKDEIGMEAARIAERLSQVPEAATVTYIDAPIAGD